MKRLYRRLAGLAGTAAALGTAAMSRAEFVDAATGTIDPSAVTTTIKGAAGNGINEGLVVGVIVVGALIAWRLLKRFAK